MSEPIPPAGDADPFRKQPPGEQPYPPQHGQPEYGQPQYGPPGYGQPAYGQPQYGPPGSPQQWGPPAQPLSVPLGYYPVFNSRGQQVLVPLASPGKRFATQLLDLLLYVVTLFIGYFIWMLFSWRNGQSPGKQLTKLKYVDTSTGRVADWSKSAYRDFIIRGIVFYFITIFTLTIGWFVAAFMTFDEKKNYQAGWDRMAGTVVVDVTNVEL